MKSIYTLAAAALLLFTTSCETAPKFDRALLEGGWNCVASNTGGVDDLNPQTIKFNFNLDSTYSYTGGAYTESGKWRLEGDKLVTIADGDLEKKVQIDKLTADSLVLKMNDRGTDVTLILLQQ